MGWEQRARGGMYYTRSKKVGGRVVREYVGTGLFGALAAELDAEQRAQRAAERESVRAARDEWERVDDAVTEVCEVSDEMARLALLLAGYHQHHRGEWRRRRGTQAT